MVVILETHGIILLFLIFLSWQHSYCWVFFYRLNKINNIFKQENIFCFIWRTLMHLWVLVIGLFSKNKTELINRGVYNKYEWLENIFTWARRWRVGLSGRVASGIRSSWCRHSTYVEITAHTGGIPFIYIVVLTRSIYSKWSEESRRQDLF